MKKDYIKPVMQVVELQQKHQLLTVSTDEFGMKNTLTTEEVDEGW